jgi:hypothetical protein
MNEDHDRIAHDPIENDPIIRSLVRQAEEEAKVELEKEALAKKVLLLDMGYCYMLWEKQKEILKKRYGIDWKSPDEMNPMILFD